MALIGDFTSKALLPSQAEVTQETQNQTIASLQAQYQELAKQISDAKASATVPESATPNTGTSSTDTSSTIDAKTSKTK